jgi:hypothetical protein
MASYDVSKPRHVQKDSSRCARVSLIEEMREADNRRGGQPSDGFTTETFRRQACSRAAPSLMRSL